MTKSEKQISRGRWIWTRYETYTYHCHHQYCYSTFEVLIITRHLHMFVKKKSTPRKTNITMYTKEHPAFQDVFPIVSIWNFQFHASFQYPPPNPNAPPLSTTNYHDPQAYFRVGWWWHWGVISMIFHPWFLQGTSCWRWNATWLDVMGCFQCQVVGVVFYVQVGLFEPKLRHEHDQIHHTFPCFHPYPKHFMLCMVFYPIFPDIKCLQYNIRSGYILRVHTINLK